MRLNDVSECDAMGGTRLVQYAAVIAIASSAVACSAPYGVRAGFEQRTFADPDHAVAWVRSKADAAIAAIPPTPAPVGGAARIYVPTRALLKQVVIREQEFRSDWYPRSLAGLHFAVVPPPLEQRVDLLELDYLILARAIERRRIFARVEILRADGADAADAPRGGYVVWMRKRPRENYAMVMASSGEREFTALKLPRDRRDPTAFLLGHVEAVEEFARTRRASAR